MPKSSIAMRTPSSLSAASRRAVSSALRISVVSVISIVSALGASPLELERPFDVIEEIVGVELARGDVDRHAERVAGLLPLGALAAGLPEDPGADVDDHPALLEQRDEVVGLDDPAPRLAPADQRLDPRRRHAREVEGRLVDEEELLVLERALEVHLELHPVLDGVLHPGLEHERSDSCRPTWPGTSRCRRRAAAPRRRIAVADGDADARLHDHTRVLGPAELERLA